MARVSDIGPLDAAVISPLLLSHLFAYDSPLMCHTQISPNLHPAPLNMNHVQETTLHLDFLILERKVIGTTPKPIWPATGVPVVKRVIALRISQGDILCRKPGIGARPGSDFHPAKRVTVGVTDVSVQNRRIRMPEVGSFIKRPVPGTSHTTDSNC